MNDLDVRAALRRLLDERHQGDENTRRVEEMGIWSGTVRIDVAVINGEFHGYELKSARDTLDRLATQCQFYSQVFDRLTLVTAERHWESAEKKIPTWWGVMIAKWVNETTIELEEIRASGFNPTIEPIQLARLLWRSEMLSILEGYEIDRGFRSKTIDVMAKHLAGSLSINELREEVRGALKARTGWLRQPVGNKGQMTVRCN